MNTQQIATSIFAAGFLALVNTNANAIPITCSTTDATANTAYATSCFGDTDVGNGASAQTGYVEAALLQDFTLVDKFERGLGSDPEEGLSDWTLNVFQVTTSGAEFNYGYTLTVPDSEVGDVVNFVLGIKQGSDSFVAYYFEGVTLGIDGGFNSFWLNGNDLEVNDYSHVTAWIDTASIPEPALLSLLGAGLIGLGLARRRKR